jgi:putative ABC transport system permease protein
MAIAIVGVAFGLAIGAVVPMIAQATLADLLPVPTVFSIYPGALILAAIYGVVTAIAFAVWPLARARDIPAAGLFRDIVAPSRKWPRPFYVALTAGALGVLAVLAVALTEDYQRLFAVWFLVGTAASFGVLLLAADLMMWVAKKAGRPKQPSLRIALANLYRPGAPTSSVVLSLGLGLTLLVTISLIDGNITRQVATQLPDRAPSFFFVDMQKAQLEPFNAILDDTDGIVSVNQVPMIRGPIVAVNGVRAGDVEATPDTRWALRGDRGFTYSAALPQGSELVRGEWWPEDYQGPPLVSFSRELAEGWNVGVGDTLTIDVLGREITAEIASLRDITWQSGGINFILVFSPGVLDNAPQTVLSTVTMEEAGELELQRRVTDAFPNVTSIRVKEAISSVSSLLEDLVLAVRATSVVTIVAGILVLAGAMAAGHRHRVYDSVVLKVLGATRARVLGAYALEYALLGFGTALIAAGAGTLAAYLVITQVMQAEWLFLPGTLAVTVVGATVITMGFGLVGTWSALSRKAAPILRSE